MKAQHLNFVYSTMMHLRKGEGANQKRNMLRTRGKDSKGNAKTERTRSIVEDAEAPGANASQITLSRGSIGGLMPSSPTPPMDVGMETNGGLRDVEIMEVIARGNESEDNALRDSLGPVDKERVP